MNNRKVDKCFIAQGPILNIKDYNDLATGLIKDKRPFASLLCVAFVVTSL